MYTKTLCLKRLTNAVKCVNAGVDILVSATFLHQDLLNNTHLLKGIVKEGE